MNTHIENMKENRFNEHYLEWWDFHLLCWVFLSNLNFTIQIWTAYFSSRERKRFFKSPFLFTWHTEELGGGEGEGKGETNFEGGRMQLSPVTREKWEPPTFIAKSRPLPFKKKKNLPQPSFLLSNLTTFYLQPPNGN